ncbi:RING-H2 finger protein ATL57-like [Rhodamnia argentea]|uniref:RING-H2 finger protein ATL57-like n=1 Tax=Rhodamnia argentea TaxID=178133 RepID=A0A8B8P6I4_9MYRT|nr:RING-H2 finger protein ATL57-like [Rhodamnia argentea]
MASPAFSPIPQTFFPALFGFASFIDSPLVQSILDGLRRYVILIVVSVLFLCLVIYPCLRDLFDILVQDLDIGPRFDDLEAGRRLPLLGRLRGGQPLRSPADPLRRSRTHRSSPESEALMRIHVYGSGGGEEAKHTDCVICLEDFKDGEECLRPTCCDHTFHKACLNRWLLERRRCPICQARVAAAVVAHTIAPRPRPILATQVKAPLGSKVKPVVKAI